MMQGLGWKEKLVLTFSIWMVVYPSVLTATWLVEKFEVGAPLPLKILMTTAMTVPLLEFVLVPLVRKLLRKVERAASIDGGLRND